MADGIENIRQTSHEILWHIESQCILMTLETEASHFAISFHQTTPAGKNQGFDCMC